MNRPVPPAKGKGPPKDEENHRYYHRLHIACIITPLCRRWSSRRRFPELRAHAATIVDDNDNDNNDDINDDAAPLPSSRDDLPAGVVALPKPKRL